MYVNLFVFVVVYVCSPCCCISVCMWFHLSLSLYICVCHCIPVFVIVSIFFWSPPFMHLQSQAGEPGEPLGPPSLCAPIRGSGKIILKKSNQKVFNINFWNLQWLYRLNQRLWKVILQTLKPKIFKITMCWFQDMWHFDKLTVQILLLLYSYINKKLFLRIKIDLWICIHVPNIWDRWCY